MALALPGAAVGSLRAAGVAAESRRAVVGAAVQSQMAGVVLRVVLALPVGAVQIRRAVAVAAESLRAAVAGVLRVALALPVGAVRSRLVAVVGAALPVFFRRKEYTN